MKLFTLLLASTMTVMSGATIAPALPSISANFSSTANTETLTKFLLSITALFIAISGPISGYLADRFGRKKLFIFTVLFYGIAGSSGLYLNSLQSLLVSRALFGLCVGSLNTLITTLVVDYYLGENRKKVMGFIGSANSFGGVIFLLLGGFLSDISWRMPFAIYLSSLIMLPLIIKYIEEPTFKKSKTVTLTLGKSAHELRNLSLVYLLAFVSTLVFYLIPTELPFYMSELKNITGTKTGIVISFSTLAGGFSALMYKRLKTRFSYQQLSFLIYLLIAGAFLSVALSSSYYQILLAMILNGAGVGLMFPNLNMWAAEFSSEGNKGKVIGGLTTGIFFGMFASPFFSKLIKTLFIGANVFLYAFLFLIALCFMFLADILLVNRNAKRIESGNP